MITEGMTVNHILRFHPAALAVLRRFHLDADWAGTEPLEQAAWYRAVHVEEIVEALNRVMAQGGER
jgi:iron-sulfur cluster repair protein YtfE (RIC family)